jgi:hypothetical protein
VQHAQGRNVVTSNAHGNEPHGEREVGIDIVDHAVQTLDVSERFTSPAIVGNRYSNTVVKDAPSAVIKVGT